MPYGMPPQGMPGMMYPGMMQPMIPQVPMMQQPMIQQPFPPGMTVPQPISPQGMPQSQPNSVVANASSQLAPAVVPTGQLAATPPKENGAKNVQLPLDRRSAKSSPPEVVEDLDFMTDLPDIS
jgi:hypothetical protein